MRGGEGEYCRAQPCSVDESVAFVHEKPGVLCNFASEYQTLRVSYSSTLRLCGNTVGAGQPKVMSGQIRVRSGWEKQCHRAEN